MNQCLKKEAIGGLRVTILGLKLPLLGILGMARASRRFLQEILVDF
jgi:hypothetical protein